MTGGTRIAHVTTVHPPFDVRIFRKQCVSLAACGFDVTLIQRGVREETVKGVRVLPLPTYRSRWTRMTRGVWDAFRLALRTRAEIVHFHDIEFIWAGLLLKLAGRKVIYDVHENVAADLYDKAYLPSWVKLPLGFVVRAVECAGAAAFDRIVPATGSIAEHFPVHRTTIIRNTPILGELAAPDGPPLRERERRVVYIGGLAPLNGVEQMIRAMGALPADSDIRLTLGGRFGSAKAEATARAIPGAERVDFLGWVGREEIAAHFARARAGLVVYQPTPNAATSEPNKFLEVLSAGLPLIASDFPHWRAFVETHGCGMIVSPTDPQMIAAAIRAMVDDPDAAEAMGVRGRCAVVEKFNWSIDEVRLTDLYRSMSTSVAAS